MYVNPQFLAVRLVKGVVKGNPQLLGVCILKKNCYAFY